VWASWEFFFFSEGEGREEKPEVADTVLLSEAALGEDWDRPEEDEAWQHLQ
jgi:hypothetical protein